MTGTIKEQRRNFIRSSIFSCIFSQGQHNGDACNESPERQAETHKVIFSCQCLAGWVQISWGSCSIQMLKVLREAVWLGVWAKRKVMRDSGGNNENKCTHWYWSWQAMYVRMYTCSYICIGCQDVFWTEMHPCSLLFPYFLVSVFTGYILRYF
jgi:hypothetical protein